MSTRFKLEIELGNDASQTYADIRGMLSTVIADLREYHDLPRPFHSRRIHDVNGNTVGTYNIEET